MALATESSPSQSSVSFETGHNDLIHDCQLDFYGKTLATASSDRTIKLFQVIRDQTSHIETLEGHSGPVWRVSWAHPKYGQILGSCGYDRRVIIWQYSASHRQWIQSLNDDQFQTSVNCLAFAPVDCGLLLVVGDSDGSVTIYGYHNSQWKREVTFKAHNGGVNSVSWAPYSNLMKKQSNTDVTMERNMRFVTCGCDNVLKVWCYDNNTNKWRLSSQPLKSHSDWVRDVAWAPIPGSASHSVIASCSEDKSVIIWKEKNEKWTASAVLKFEDKVWSVSWSELGNLLAVASNENQIQLFKQSIDGKWNQVSKINPSQ